MFIKPFLDSNMIDKVSLSPASAGLETLKLDIAEENIPEVIGGTNKTYNESYQFNVSTTGPFYYPGAPIVDTDNELSNVTDSTGTSSSIDHLVSSNASTPIASKLHTKLSETETKKAVLLNLQAKSLLKYSSRTETEQEQRLEKSGFGLRTEEKGHPPLPQTHSVPTGHSRNNHPHKQSGVSSTVGQSHAVHKETHIEHMENYHPPQSHYLSTGLIILAALLVCYLGDIGASYVIIISVVVGSLTALLPI